MQSPACGEEKIHTLCVATSWTAALHRMASEIHEIMRFNLDPM